MIPVICCLDLHNGLHDALFVSTPGLGSWKDALKTQISSWYSLAYNSPRVFRYNFKKSETSGSILHVPNEHFFLSWPYPLCPQVSKSYDCFIVSQESRTSWHLAGTQYVFVERMNKSLPFFL